MAKSWLFQPIMPISSTTSNPTTTIDCLDTPFAQAGHISTLQFSELNRSLLILSMALPWLPGHSHDVSPRVDPLVTLHRYHNLTSDFMASSVPITVVPRKSLFPMFKSKRAR